MAKLSTVIEHKVYIWQSAVEKKNRAQGISMRSRAWGNINIKLQRPKATFGLRRIGIQVLLQMRNVGRIRLQWVINIELLLSEHPSIDRECVDRIINVVRRIPDRFTENNDHESWIYAL